MKTSGQWVGKFESLTPGWAALSIERGHLDRAFANVVQEGNVPASRIDFDIQIKGDLIKAQSTNTRAFDRKIGQLVSADEYMRTHPGEVIFSKLTTVEAKMADNRIIGTWQGDAIIEGQPLSGRFELTNTFSKKAPEADKIMSWADFKEFVASLIRDGKNFYFRGQGDNRWKLLTSFHRHERYDLLRYDQTDIAELLHRVNATSEYNYDLQKPGDYGALLSLAQHHGFPTPLLDWTRSPYVAAYFAFENRPKTGQLEGYSRIFVFDGNKWSRDNYQAASISDPHPVITVHEFPARNNPRHLPQQSAHFFSNVEDLEWWVHLLEDSKKTKYLTRIDIPYTEREPAMRELAYMGVSAATMFPGMEGVCKAIKERYFIW